MEETIIHDRLHLLHGDCMDYMRDIPDKYFDLAVVDPPYGIDVSNLAIGNRKFKALYRGNGTWDKHPPQLDYFKKLIRVSKEQIIWGANHFISKLPYDSSCWLVWDKDNEGLSFADCELAWTSFSSSVKKFKKAWRGAHAKEREENDRIHPTQKPVALYEWIYANYAKEGMKILDTHLGSGSSAIAAFKIDMNIEFTGIEIDDIFYRNTVKRVREMTLQNSLF